MTKQLTKGDIVLFALRKAAIASDATQTEVEPPSMEDGINDLEDLMAELQIKFGDFGYQFSLDEKPSTDDESGLPSKYKHAIGYQLMLRMLSDYGIEPTPRQEASAYSSYDSLLTDTLNVPSIERRGDMPIGQGNKYTSLSNDSYYVERNFHAKDTDSNC
ncbi:packaged DNA stabilization gp4 family protein [Arsenophonus nasoniae]|uniref:P22 tail accessory factor n=1 Tax=Arsenophonus nasoniae TaxID=638 RepID=D2U1Z9_9GAMM|nr:packaged DNA stabilization gp4 family protein [Arsenophonus nasoniae]QBY44411.1 P22 tail accessory factor [Arsenophonus nasoniae]WGM04670.1 packaged DNA stabilization gp4 family protein [Arsenophonus nasoniae]WGM09784.1 packaged DNA stabilization gp4 family protein [Arsenophonus nasoniae]WGM14503.1 packaged DNA stabilization gp4 family protein [Arsenophonus nasoniae]CBA74921.1 phage DNA stabilization protein [Arsenophonus nasoniae]